MLTLKPDTLSGKPFIFYSVFAGLIWFVISLISAYQYTNWQAEQTFKAVEKKTQSTQTETHEGIERTLSILHSIPNIMARDKDIQKVLRQLDSLKSGHTFHTREEMRAFFEENKQLNQINQSLLASIRDIGVISILWVLGPDGITIAASNAGTDESFVGTSYADREYFRSSMAGLNGYLPAIGRRTNVPGLFFSAPVIDGNKVTGVIAAKIDLAYLSNWINQNNGFLVDKYGVIIQAEDPQFEMMTIPGAAVNSLTEQQRLERYKRTEFTPLSITRWSTDFSENLVRIGNLKNPFYTLSAELVEDKLKLMIAIEAPSLGNKDVDRKLLFLIIAVVGWLIIALITILAYHYKTTQIAKKNRNRQELIEHLASYDALTGLYSRALTDRLIMQGVAIASRNKKNFAVLFIDLDLFKDINDSFGHEVGDNTLRELATRIKSSVRQSDIIIRHGGDEFIVLLQDIPDPSAAASVAVNIQNAIRHPYVVENTALTLSASIGISMYPSDGDTASLLLRRADTALYNTKRKGRADYSFYQTQMSVDLAARKALEADMTRALEKGEFFLVYQPQYSIEQECISGCEALIRWRHPTRGIVPPLEFIPAAERSGFIVPLGKWILNEACRQSRAWRDELNADILVAVNLSAIQFQRTDLLQCVKQALGDNQASSIQLELEMTESLMMSDTEHTLDVMKELKALGIRISIDDFGTGYSSLAYLKKFDADVLKIDQTFIRCMENNANDRAIVRAVINMAQNIDYRVTAEGVETEYQFEFLRELKCDSIQGYWFSKPLPADAFTRFFRENRNKKLGSSQNT